MNIIVLLLLSLLVAVSSAGYTLRQNWNGAALINNWNYFTGPDPTHGYVYYASKQQAQQWGYVYTDSQGKAIIRSDSTSVSSGSGRGSVRIQSPITFTKGIVLFDCEHMPTGMGAWPAFWTTEGVHWPNGGEIDILEGVNDQTNNQITLHTASGCYVPTNQDYESGVPVNGDCYGNMGCAIKDYDTKSYGAGFNANGGGVYAMQWEDSGVYVWFFPRSSIPSDISSGNINPGSWGMPRARFTFNQGCVGSQFFYNHGIILDNTFCGDWAGNTYPGGMAACENYVKNNYWAFTEAYWRINYVKLYQQ